MADPTGPAGRAAHTPGPWTIRHGTNVFAVRRDVGHESSVANTGGFFNNKTDVGPENEANARLVAAAPDLFAACREVLLWSMHSGAFCEPEDEAVLAAVTAAVRKATTGGPTT